jgi:hypothetical protein
MASIWPWVTGFKRSVTQIGDNARAARLDIEDLLGYAGAGSKVMREMHMLLPAESLPTA